MGKGASGVVNRQVESQTPHGSSGALGVIPLSFPLFCPVFMLLCAE